MRPGYAIKSEADYLATLWQASRQPEVGMTPVLMNNYRRRDHVWHFGRGAFFDLDREGKQAEMATEIGTGDVCIVASQNPQRTTVTFAWFKMSHVKNMVDRNGGACRVFFGEQTKSESMPKKKAAKVSLCRAYFNKRGHFKQLSVVPS
jgi:hypothetical protein